MNGSGIAPVEFQQALALHRQGRTDDAARAYEQILLAEPAHLDALDPPRRASPWSGPGRRGGGVAAAGRGGVARTRPKRSAISPRRCRRRAGTTRRPRITNARSRASRTCWMRASAWPPACRRAGRARRGDRLLRDDPRSPTPAHPEANYGLATLLAQLGRADEAACEISRRAGRRSGLCRGELRAGQAARTRRCAGGSHRLLPPRARCRSRLRRGARGARQRAVAARSRRRGDGGVSRGARGRTRTSRRAQRDRHPARPQATSRRGHRALPRRARPQPGACRRDGGHGKRPEEHRPA